MTHSLTADAQPRSVTGRMVAVKEMAQLQRMLFEIEREFVRTATTLVYRVGDVELKYLICQHVWESAGHARFLRERGRELSGFGKDECVRESYSAIFEEAVRAEDSLVALVGFYRVLKPALLAAYRHYLETTHHLADWPSRKLVEEFILDEERHADEVAQYLQGVGGDEWTQHLSIALSAIGGWLGERESIAARHHNVLARLRVVAAGVQYVQAQRGHAGLKFNAIGVVRAAVAEMVADAQGVLAIGGDSPADVAVGPTGVIVAGEVAAIFVANIHHRIDG